MMKYSIIALLVAGCAGSTVPHAFRPIGFTVNEVQLIKDAAQEWSDKSDGKYLSIIDENCSTDVCSTIEKVSNITDQVRFEGIDVYDKEEPSAGGLCMSYVDYGLGLHATGTLTDDAMKYKIVILDSLTTISCAEAPMHVGKPCEVNFKTVVMHEMGHSWGKPHKSPHTTMYFQEGSLQADELTDEDLR